MSPDRIDVSPEAIAVAMKGTFPGDLGIELTEVGEDGVRATMPVDRRHLHAGGVVHGGAWTAFADTIAAWGTAFHAGTMAFTTLELKVNLFGAGRPGDVLSGHGVPLHVGRRTQVWEVRVVNGERDAGHFVCTQLLL